MVLTFILFIHMSYHCKDGLPYTFYKNMHALKILRLQFHFYLYFGFSSMIFRNYFWKYKQALWDSLFTHVLETCRFPIHLTSQSWYKHANNTIENPMKVS